MGSAADGQEIVRLAKEYAELKPVAEAAGALVKAREEQSDLEEMIGSGDAEMAGLARGELEALRTRLPELEHAMALLLAPKDKDEHASAILEVRAGTGGDEAALFAGDLFRMYQRYAQKRGWRVEVDSVSEGEAGGYKEIIASISGDGVFGRLKFESGVHRVQRVPETEAQGRIHTSAATVAVLPEARRRRDRGRGQGHPHRHLSFVGRGRPAREQDRQRRTHYPFAHRHRGDLVGKIPTPEPRQGDEGAEGAFV